MKQLKKSGITIAEMCVVLAVIAIASAVIVSFTVMVNARSSASVAKLNAQNDIEASRFILRNWVDRMHTEGAYVNASEKGLHAVKSNGENSWEYKVILESDRLVAQLPGGEMLTCPITQVEEIHFKQLPEVTVDRDVLYFCTVVYFVKTPTGEEVEFEDTFTIRSRVGQTVTP